MYLAVGVFELMDFLVLLLNNAHVSFYLLAASRVTHMIYTIKIY